MRYKIIKDFRGYVLHSYLNENNFTYQYVDYERDEYNGRCYQLVETTDLRPEMDGALVRRRISNAAYEEARKAVLNILEEGAELI